MKRLFAALLSLSALASGGQARPGKTATDRPPSVLVILLDQAAQKAVGAYGTPLGPHPPHRPSVMQGTRFANVYVTTPLVSSLDLFPTPCGRSLAGWLRGDPSTDSREYVVSQWHSEYGELVTPGRMLRTQRYKYVRYLEGDGEELYDLAADPGEQRTLIRDPAHAEALRTHRERLERVLTETVDPFRNPEVKVDPRWRRHAVGYPNHRGPSSLDEARVGAERGPRRP